MFDSLLVFENYPIDRMVAAKGARLGITDLRVIDATNFPVTLIVTPGDMMELKLLHNRARLSDAEADRLLRSLSCILTGMAADCERPLRDLPLVDAAEHARLIDDGKGPDRDWRRSELLHRLVEEQAGRTPEATAVRFSGQDLSYRELDCRANQLAICCAGMGSVPIAWSELRCTDQSRWWSASSESSRRAAPMFR